MPKSWNAYQSSSKEENISVKDENLKEGNSPQGNHWKFKHQKSLAKKRIQIFPNTPNPIQKLHELLRNGMQNSRENCLSKKDCQR